MRQSKYSYATTPPTGFTTSNELKSSPLFKHQVELKKLPLPTLNRTLEKLQKFLLAIEYKVKDANRDTIEDLLAEFKRDLGPKLQMLLEKRAEEKLTSFGWFYEWWNDYAYLSDRSPLVFYVSYFYAFKKDLFALFLKTCYNDVEKQCRVASLLAYSSIILKSKIILGELEPEMAGSSILCSIMYPYLYNACRVPREKKDTTLVYDVKKYNHFVVMFKNSFYQISGDPQRTFTEIEKDIFSILNSKPAADLTQHPIGILTAINRDDSCKAFSVLESISPRNVEFLDIIRTSMFIICLDSVSPSTIEERCRLLWHGDGENRFFDKALQFIVFPNGDSGFLGEHSMMDGSITNRTIDEVFRVIATIPPPGNITDSCSFTQAPSTKQDVSVSPLSWEFSSELLTLIDDAKRSFSYHKSIHSFCCLFFSTFGKIKIKEWGFSPDSFVQNAIQLAYFRYSATIGASYEATQMRRFEYARTDVTRSPSLETAEWLYAMDNKEVSPTKKLELLSTAIKTHAEQVKEVSGGGGIDRHLLGLELIAKENNIDIPKLFTHPLYLKSKKWVLSTSQITAKHNDAWGYGPVVEEGFGLPYAIYDQLIYIGISVRSEEKICNEFRDNLVAALHSMRDLIIEVRRNPNTKSSL